MKLQSNFQRKKLGTLTISIQFFLCYINRCKNNAYEMETR